MTSLATATHVVVGANALQSIPQNDQLILDATADFIEISYGFKRKVTINPDSAIRHIREFLSHRMADDYHEDFVTYVTNYKKQEIERANEEGADGGFHANRNKKLLRKKPTKESRISSAKEDSLKEDYVPAKIKEKAAVKITPYEAYEWMLQTQTATLEKKFLTKIQKSDNEETADSEPEDRPTESKSVEIIDFLTDQGELLCLHTFTNENIHHAVALNTSHPTKQLTRQNNMFILARVKLVYGEIREITPLVVNPALMAELLPLCSAWLKNHIVTSRRKKEALRRLAEAQAAQSQPVRGRKK